MAEVLEGPFLPRTTSPRAFVDAHFAEPARRPRWTAALRLDTEVMLVDDPVKRVDNMTMAHGLEARTPFLDHELVELPPPARRSSSSPRAARAS